MGLVPAQFERVLQPLSGFVRVFASNRDVPNLSHDQAPSFSRPALPAIRITHRRLYKGVPCSDVYQQITTIR